ncbi:hypothetical protein, partial [uncultured Lamprocystis sp.]|uniref:hypothetical protein n=1 Tax=uncultured Lamprocystis sp. TaxID=543132 RepID=UPI0025D27843
MAQREANDNMGAVVTVRVTSGQEYQKRVRYPKGTSQNPMTEEDLEEKFRANLGPVVSTDRIATLLGRRVDKRQRSPPNPAPTLVDCAALVHPTM